MRTLYSLLMKPHYPTDVTHGTPSEATITIVDDDCKLK